MITQFAIFTHVEHYQSGKDLLAYEPYVREMNIWIKFVESVTIVAPQVGDRKPVDTVYNHSQIHFEKIPSINFQSIPKIFKSFFALPIIFFKIFKTMYKSDHIHIRCPGNIGLLAAIAQIFFPSKSKTVKYAGNWDPQSRQPLSYRFQKWLLNNTFFSKNIKVLIYGNWPNQSINVHSFFTASFSNSDIVRINKNLSIPIRFLFVGTFSSGKQPLEAIKLCKLLSNRGVPLKLEFYGEGEELVMMKNFIKQENLSHLVEINQFLPLTELKRRYIDSHFLLLPSKSEGWPKVVAEAMFFGCVPIVTNISCIPWMLDAGKRGIILDSNFENSIEKIIEIIKSESIYLQVSKEAQIFSNKYTLERFEEEILALL
ncbi:glycosyltransferase [Christiangramia portivictoriae]|uniref:glycosyltransferase n=1 Tax=Christiangramia portivictoriae TaxID=326069 RepID=UPI0004245FFB|nr:glycosyltransferase [Christiangramia portivictoriae]